MRVGPRETAAQGRYQNHSRDRLLTRAARIEDDIIEAVSLEKTLLHKVGEAIHRFKMIRDGDRVAVALSGGKDSATMLEALLLLQKRAPVDFSVCSFTVEQGKFLRPIEPIGEYLKQRGIPWT